MTSKTAHQALNSHHWPTYLGLKTVEFKRNTHLSQDGVRIKHGVSDSFQDQARIYNTLPKSIREQTSSSIFSSCAKRFYKDKAAVRLSS